MGASTVTTTQCFHCGDPCREEHVHAHDKDFCCTGCKAVYELLQESGLSNYYSLTERPGVKETSTGDALRAELLELEAVRSKFVEFSEDGITRVVLNVPQMHCSSCIWLLENLDRIEPSVMRSRVRFTTKELSITFRESSLSLQSLVRLLRRIGYGPQLNNERKQDNPAAATPASLYIKLGVAGACFGNIMLFSFPEYLGADTQDAGLLKGFAFMKLALSLPVVFVSSTDFFRSAWSGVRARQVNIDQPIALGIIALFLRSVLDVSFGIGPGYFDSLAGLIFFLLIGRWYQSFTYRALSFDRQLNDFLPLVVLRKRGDREEPVGVADLVPGDRIVVRDQELVPVDAMLREGTGHIDNSFITGEPLPVRKMPGDAIKAGGRQRGAAIELEVVRAFQQSNLKRIWEENSGGERIQRPLMPRLIDGIARRFTLIVLLISLGAGLYWWGRDAAQVWPVVTAVLIVACPCALALSMPFAYGHTIRLLGRSGLFLRDAEVVERMAHINSVVFDKTGTLTARDAFDLEFVGSPLTEREARQVRSLARNSTHPLSVALYNGIRSTLLPVTGVQETAGAGIQGTIDHMTIALGSASFTHASSVDVPSGRSVVHLSFDGEQRGHFLLSKRARAGMRGAIERIRRTSNVFLLTGDRSLDPSIADAFGAGTALTGRTPQQKASFVLEQQQLGHRVMMVGDGLNDAGALQQCDVGITVSESSAALTPASDAILDARSLEILPEALLLTRRARKVVFASLIISFCYNITGVTFAVTGHLTPLVAAILMPLSSVTVVGFVTLCIWASARPLRRAARS